MLAGYQGGTLVRGIVPIYHTHISAGANWYWGPLVRDNTWPGDDVLFDEHRNRSLAGYNGFREGKSTHDPVSGEPLRLVELPEHVKRLFFAAALVEKPLAVVTALVLVLP